MLSNNLFLCKFLKCFIINSNITLPLSPTGGFYQDEMGHASNEPGGIGCKYCNPGTFVSPEHAPGRSASDCDVCPTGISKQSVAMFRACPCLDDYYRRDRFGPCQLCPAKGINCSNEYYHLMSGYWWTWNFYKNTTLETLQIQKYKEYAQNILTHNRNYQADNNNFDEPLPKAFACLRGKESCLVSYDGVESVCAKEYEGWLCSKCSSGYYSWFEYCIKCQEVWQMVVEVVLVSFIVCICIAIIIWDSKQNRSNRSILDILIDRFKIVLGYYQIVGTMFTSLHNIQWPHWIPRLATVFKALELNIFKLLAKPSCYIEELNMNIYREFFMGLTFFSLVVFLPGIVYACKFAYNVRLRRNDDFTIIQALIVVTKNLQKTRAKCYFFVLSMLFISYLSMCDVIFSLMPEACKRFCIDENEEVCVYRLRSDYSIDCETTEHDNFTTGAYVALIYVIGFPFCVLFVLKRNVNRKTASHDPFDIDNQPLCTEESENSTNTFHGESQTIDINDTNNDNSNDIEETRDDNLQRQPRDETQPRNVDIHDSNYNTFENEMPTPDEEGTNNDNEGDWSLQYPLYIRFLIGSYKKKYFYWEIVELCRKVLQTVLVVLYGTQDPLTLAATMALSMAFIAIHAYCRPMKNPFEQWLQMISLVAIFLNLLTAVVLMVPYDDTSGQRGTAMAVFIIGLNVSVVFLAVGKD